METVMAAPLLGALRPCVHRFRLGAFEVTTLLDGAQVRSGISPPFGVDQGAESVARLAAGNALPHDRFENTYTPAIVNTGSHLVLFDAGNGELRPDASVGRLRERLATAGYAPEQIDILAFTHVHPDHIGGVYHAGRLAFPNARYAIGRLEFDAWSRGDKIPPQRKENLELFRRLIAPLADRMTFLRPGDDLVPGVRAVGAFGHSLGHLAYAIASEGKNVLLWGDTANHYVLSLQNPGWQVAFDDDKAQAVDTRRRILDMAATERLLVIGHHMPFPAVGFVERHGGGYRWAPASYQPFL
jgi:glyoxylase-like metal-dependent hydrolase (beta-lactamase superfamily II)